MNWAKVSWFPFEFGLYWNYKYELERITLKLSPKPGLKVEHMSSKTVLKALERFLIELERYFKKETSFLEVPHTLKVSDFTKRVLFKLREIRLGETRTYKDIAESLGLKRGYQAVGQALKLNPLPLLYPCHRVISKTGLGGFSQGLLVKWLLIYWELNGDLTCASNF